MSKHDVASNYDYELLPVYDKGSVFKYGRAYVSDNGVRLKLYSDGEWVAGCTAMGDCYVFMSFNITDDTRRHVVEFLKQQGAVVENDAQIWANYGKTNKELI